MIKADFSLGTFTRLSGVSLKATVTALEEDIRCYGLHCLLPPTSYLLLPTSSTIP